MNKIFVETGLFNNGALSFVDDCIAHGSGPAQLFERVQRLLNAFLIKGFRFDPTKFRLSFAEVEFLSHVLVDGKHYPSPSKVQALLDLTQPKDVQGIMSFIGCFGYFATYIPDFSGLCRPLNRLKRKDVPFIWSPACEAAFHRLKYELIKATCLYNPVSDPECPFVIMTDASDTTLSSCLLQEVKGKMHPISFNSRLLTNRERRNFC